jgi:hypothetical protein
MGKLTVPMRNAPRIGVLAFALASLALSSSGAQAANVCEGKRWVAAPVLALGDSSGIGGTGHGNDNSGIGGTGHGDGSGIGGTGHGDNSGIGGTGRGGDDEGIGGTGRSGDGMGGTGAVASGARGDEGNEGMGGTGHGPAGASDMLAHDEQGMGGTGIVGVIAGFGSICVNGLELHYDAATPTSMDGSPTRTDKLALGQAVSVRVGRVGGKFQAREIAVLNSISGRVEQVDAATGTVRILGQVLHLPGKLAVRAGDWLTVSGSRLADGSILPTRVVRQIVGGTESVMGPVGLVSGQSFHIGRLALRTAAGQPAPTPGAEVLVRGRTEHGIFQAESVLAQPLTAFRAPVGRLDIQGYVRQADRHGLNVDGVVIALPPGHVVSNAGQNGPAAGSRVEVSARVEADGRIVAERLTLERPAADMPSLSQGKASHDVTASGSEGALEAPSVEQETSYSAGQVLGASPVTAADITATPEVENEATRPKEREASHTEREGSEQSRSQGARNETARHAIARPEVVRPEVVRPEVVKPEILRPEIVRPEIVRPEIVRPEIVRPEIVRPEIVRPEIVRPEIVRPEIVRPEIVRPEIVRPEIVRPEIVRPEIVRPEIVRPEIVRPERTERPERPSRD